MIHNDQSSLDKSLKQLHSDLIAIADLHAHAAISHEFLKYVFLSLAEDLPCDSQPAILLDHLLTSFFAENECFLRESKTRICRALENIRKVES